MRAKLLAVPLLVGAGFLVGLGGSDPIAHAQQKGRGVAKAPVNRPAPRPNNPPRAQTPAAAQRPAPRPSAPTMSRPSAPAQPPRQPAARPTPQRPAIGERP